MRNRFADGGTVRFLPVETPLIHHDYVHVPDSDVPVLVDYDVTCPVCTGVTIDSNASGTTCNLNAIDTESGELLTLSISYLPYRSIIDSVLAYERFSAMALVRSALLSRMFSIRGRQHARRRRGL